MVSLNLQTPIARRVRQIGSFPKLAGLRVPAPERTVLRAAKLKLAVSQGQVKVFQLQMAIDAFSASRYNPSPFTS